MEQNDIWHEKNSYKPNWPLGVRPITIGESNLIGVDKKKTLYFDGQRIEYSLSLTWWQKTLATAAALSAVSIAIFDILRFFRIDFL